MKGIGKVMVAMLLAITICLGAMPTQSAYAGVDVGVDVSIDVNQTIDQILGLFKFEGKRYVVVINKTEKMMPRVGAYNNSANWPAGDVNGLTAQQTLIIGTQPGDTHSFAANYQVTGGQDIYFQFGSSWPLIGKRKINMCAQNQAGNDPAESCWDEMSGSNDVNLNNKDYSGRAMIKSIPTSDGEALAWVYEVKPK